MNIHQAATAITELEKQGHRFRLLSDGTMTVSNVTPPVAAFCRKFSEILKQALASRQQEQLAKANFPGAQIVERRTWAQIRSEWRELCAHLPREEQLLILARTVGELQGADGEAIALRLLSEESQGAPAEVLDVFFRLFGRLEAKQSA